MPRDGLKHWMLAMNLLAKCASAGLIVASSAGFGLVPRAQAANKEIPATPAPVTDVIRVASTIYSDGEILATPVVELIPGIVGEVTVSTSKDKPLTIFFGTTDVLRTKEGAPYVNLELSAVRSGEAAPTQLNSTSIGLALGQEGSVDVSTAGRSQFRITVVAISRPILSEEILNRHLCEGSSVSPADVRNSGCCSAQCSNSPETTLTCCNVISCCDGVCGACCSP